MASSYAKVNIGTKLKPKVLPAPRNINKLKKSFPPPLPPKYITTGKEQTVRPPEFAIGCHSTYIDFDTPVS
ncbi:hypothetical protein ACF0H5_009329 [Mactra antiquata]